MILHWRVNWLGMQIGWFQAETLLTRNWNHFCKEWFRLRLKTPFHSSRRSSDKRRGDSGMKQILTLFSFFLMFLFKIGISFNPIMVHQVYIVPLTNFNIFKTNIYVVTWSFFILASTQLGTFKNRTSEWFELRNVQKLFSKSALKDILNSHRI